MVTGSGTYTLDWNFPNTAHAWFVRADRAHAEITSIDASAALAMPGVVAVLTGDDLKAAGFKTLPVLTLPIKPGAHEPKMPFRPCLAYGKVLLAGEAVACVIAESQQLAMDASEQVHIEYRELPPVVDALDALKPGAPQLHDDVPGNLYWDYEDGNKEKTDELFAKAARIVKHDLYNHRVVGNPLEPRCCTGLYDAEKDQYFLYSPTQGPRVQASMVAKTLGVPTDKVDVVARDTGGGFGIRSAVYPEYCVTLLASRKLGRPVLWNGTRSEVFLTDNQARDFICHGELALDDQGKFLAMRFHIVANNGAYLAPTGLLAQTRSVTSCITGVYDVPVAHARIQLVATNTAQVSAYRGAGRPIMSTLLECLVERAAIDLKIDPVEIRRRNLIRNDQYPYKLTNGTTYDCGDFEGMLDNALKAADWQGFEKRRAESAKRGKLRGRALSTYIESTAAGGVPDEAQLMFEPDGTITLRASSHSHGQGHETSFAQVVSGVLGLPMESIKLRTGEAGMRVQGGGTGGSRSMVSFGSSFLLGAQEVVKKARELAAMELEAAAEDIVFDHGEFSIEGTDRKIGLKEIIKKHQGPGAHPLNSSSAGKWGMTFPNGAHIAEVEIDPETGVSDIASYIAVDDIGNVITHALVEGQMQGGLTQGAGQIFGGNLVHWPAGKTQLDFVALTLTNARQHQATGIGCGVRTHRTGPTAVVPGHTDRDVVCGQATCPGSQRFHQTRRTNEPSLSIRSSRIRPLISERAVSSIDGPVRRKPSHRANPRIASSRSTHCRPPNEARNCSFRNPRSYCSIERDMSLNAPPVLSRMPRRTAVRIALSISSAIRWGN